MKGIRLLKVSQRKRSQDRLLEINPLISTMTITNNNNNSDLSLNEVFN